MIFIYHDFAGTHSTSLAAACHLKLLTPTKRKLTREEILAVPYFNKLTKKDVGKLIFHGKDEEGNEVYTVARRRFKQAAPLLLDFYLLLENKYEFKDKLVLSNTSPTVPLAMTFGGMFSRGLKIDVIGVPLLVKGAQQSSEVVFKLVEHTKQAARKETEKNVIILDNKNFKV
ncbi:DUF3189 family protein [Niallia endozanthoxylica]|uniref:DUF3189 family protein n=1 Tax=Niallia endozanthoxylica TaxID=2036016 RepID=A0A5J5HCX9_9BACI|nr:DUF3189 family protein [Niallia endozanthoxylica]KAA9018027.1 DUF3189 family protein [Niallia endozanthoxylica]